MYYGFFWVFVFPSLRYRLSFLFFSTSLTVFVIYMCINIFAVVVKLTQLQLFSPSGHSSVNYQPQETRSRLSKSADQVLQDNVALPHFMHYMEQRGADHLVRFWLEAESFRSASWSRVRAHSLNSVKHSSLAEPVPVSPEGSDPQTLVQSTPSDPNISREGNAVTSEWREPSSTEAGLRPSTPRADTPNRQATSRAGTPCKGQSSSTLRDLSDKLMKS